MKIRTDFVTNSSSSGFVAISVKLKSGETLSVEQEYETGYGGYIWSGNDSYELDMGFDYAKSGNDVLAVMRSRIDDFDTFVLDGPKGKAFKQGLAQITDVFSSIESIFMQESTHFDTGERRGINYRYVFKKRKKVEFATPESVTPSFNTQCCYYGDFAVGDTKAVMDMISSRGWHLGAKWLGGEWSKIQPLKGQEYDYRLFIIGDKTAAKIEEVGFEEYAKTDNCLKSALILQRKFHFLFIKESDFIKLGDCEIPWSVCPKIDSDSELVFSPCGGWSVEGESENGLIETEPAFNYIFNCGMRVSVDTQIADVLVVADDYYRYSGNLSGLRARGKKKSIVITQSTFVAATQDLRKQGRTVVANSLKCDGKKIMVALLGKEKKWAMDYIQTNGGSVVDHDIKFVPEIDVLLYRPADYLESNQRVIEAQDRINRGEPVLLLTFEEFKKAVGFVEEQTKKSTRKKEKDPYNAEDMKKIWKYETVEDGVCLTDCKKRNATEIMIPERIGRRPVVMIGANVFAGCLYYNDHLKSVTIPEGIKRIGDEAFRDCTGLTSITIPAGIIEISDKAFKGCASLASVTIPDSVTKIGKEAFAKCAQLTSVTLPDGVTAIGESAFEECTGLTSINIPNGVRVIDQGVFRDCTSLPSIAIPAGVTEIQTNAFHRCAALQTIELDPANTAYQFTNGCLIRKSDGVLIRGTNASVIPDDGSVKKIAACAFSGCGGLASAVIPAGVTEIGGCAFYGCESLRSVTIPAGITQIDVYVFFRCMSLTSIAIPASVTKIGIKSFSGCERLTSVTIPNPMTEVSIDVFENCPNLTICAPAGSKAEEYARSNNVAFRAI